MEEMSKYWSDTVRNAIPYIPGEQPKDKRYIKLNTNENPYPPSPGVIDAIKRSADGSLRLYPDPDCTELRETCAKYYGVGAENVFAGNGSDELLAFSFQAFFNPGSTIIFPDITYTFYLVYARFYNIDFRLVPLNAEFEISADDLARENEGIVLANPNAPTGKVLPAASIVKILDSNTDNVVIIDEAYIDFGGESAVKYIDQFPNLLVIKTLSKSHSLAGMRIGFAFGQAHLIKGLDRIKNSFNSYTLDRLALAAAKAALEDTEYYSETSLKVIRTREKTTEELRKLGFYVVDSAANFIFASYKDIPGEFLFKRLRDMGVLVRYFNKPRIENFIRVSIGTDEEMEILLNAAGKIVCEK